MLSMGRHPSTVFDGPPPLAGAGIEFLRSHPYAHPNLFFCRPGTRK